MTITVGMTPNEIEESFNIFDFEDEDWDEEESDEEWEPTYEDDLMEELDEEEEESELLRFYDGGF